jgi:hypothetical protein
VTERPFVTGVNGTLMARRTLVRPAQISVPCSLPSSIAAIPRAGGRRGQAREATAKRLGLDTMDPAETIEQRGACTSATVNSARGRDAGSRLPVSAEGRQFDRVPDHQYWISF